MAKPNMHVIVVMGDGDSMAIGGNHLIHAARRNIGVTALILNNNIYGMTGGQCSPTTPAGSFSMTTPLGQMEQSFDCVELCTAAKANYVARGTILTPCHTQYGRKNKYKTPVDMYKMLKKDVIDIERYEKLSDADKAKKV
ncbi:2-oxoacid:ferredoxin oxidoreductase subunit beta, partial [Aduncisulcus paluster]